MHGEDYAHYNAAHRLYTAAELHGLCYFYARSRIKRASVAHFVRTS